MISMKEYTVKFFSYTGCTLHQQGNVLTVELIPELAQHFGKRTLRLVFQSEHVERNTELVTHGSYIANRIYDLLKYAGEKVSVTLPKKEENTHPYPSQEGNEPTPDPSQEGNSMSHRVTLSGINCSIKTERSREIRRTEVYMIFRVTYYSDEKIEEIIIIGVDFEGNLHIPTEFPYSPEVLKGALSGGFPFTRKHAKEIYDRCAQEVSLYAKEKALEDQEKLAEHFHENVTRLEAYYQQMINEVPAVEKNREHSIQQLQNEYEIKAADELKKCQIQVVVTPISFCTITVPFRRYRYTFRIGRSKNQVFSSRTNGTSEVTVDLYHNLFSGEWVYPRCESCGHEMRQVGICEVKSHPVCHSCLVECHECGTKICRDCGVEVCFECGEWVCHQCSEQCHICQERFCSRHLLGCQLCRTHFCRQCSDLCEVCEKPVGKIHLIACEISYKLACPACIGVCSCCRKQVDQSLIRSCAFCGQQACAECTFQCAVCGETFCVHHILECEVTNNMVCPRHSGSCEHCSRHVSTECLNDCDVCGKAVCMLCSTQCHHCGNFFCEEHAGEMLQCPECGEMYCVLCYSGQGLCAECRKRMASSRVAR